MRHLAIRLAYNGTAYHGWQMQKGDVSVQEVLEEALSKVCGEPVKSHGCGRTDAGVHALRYCADFRTNCTIPVGRVALALNARLPDDICVSDCCEVEDSFNAILSCRRKEYIYRIHNSRIPDPFNEHRVCFYPGRLNFDDMKKAAGFFVGTHDFAAVRSVGTETQTTVRTVYRCDLDKAGDMITLTISANGFLYNMVRAITGTLVFAGCGKIAPESIPELLALCDRRLAGPTMPPGGLYMNRVWYEGPAGIMMGTSAPDGTPVFDP